MVDVEVNSSYLGGGITEQQLREAIEKSGYPLQSAIVDRLGRHFPMLGARSFIQEEWTYIDLDSGEVRAIDALVDFTSPTQEADDGKRAVTPCLNLVVECKQSALPYVFFLRHVPLSDRLGFPEVAGLKSDILPIFFGRLDDKTLEQVKSGPFPGFGMTYHDALAFHDIDFFSSPCPLGISLSKAMWKKGGAVELTGEDAYRSLTLPILKAMDHVKRIVEPKERSRNVTFRFVVGLAVLRAPMIGVSRVNDENHLERVPWVRMSYLEPTAKGFGSRTQHNVRFYDIVHEDFLENYLALLKDAIADAASRINRNADIIVDQIACSCNEGKSESAPDDGDHRIHQEQREWISKRGSTEPRYFVSRHSTMAQVASAQSPTELDAD